MTRHNVASELLAELDKRGYRLRIAGQEIRYHPKKLPEDLAAHIRVHRDGLFEILLQREVRMPVGDAVTSQLSRFVPSILGLVRTRQGRLGLIWGVSIHGVMVSFGQNQAILTMDLREVELFSHAAENDSGVLSN